MDAALACRILVGQVYLISIRNATISSRWWTWSSAHSAITTRAYVFQCNPKLSDAENCPLITMFSERTIAQQFLSKKTVFGWPMWNANVIWCIGEVFALGQREKAADWVRRECNNWIICGHYQFAYIMSYRLWFSNALQPQPTHAHTSTQLKRLSGVILGISSTPSTTWAVAAWPMPHILGIGIGQICVTQVPSPIPAHSNSM